MCTTVGLGTMQLTAGVHHNWGVGVSDQSSFNVLAVATAGYLASATLAMAVAARSDVGRAT